MRDTPGAIELLLGTYGERVDRQHSRLRRDAFGRYASEVTRVGQMAKWLPNVKVAACMPCNSGWMSVLEDQAKSILGPFILGEATHVKLSADDLTTLATWATKSWMAYALLRAPTQNPFTVEEYGAMATNPAPLERSQIWILHSRDPGSHVAMALESTLITTGEPPDLSTAQDNMGFGLLSVANVVFFLQLMPPDAPEGSEQYFAPDLLADPRTARRIWPNLRPQYFPLEEFPPGHLQALVDYPGEFIDAIGLPTVGLNEADTLQVAQDFRDGADPRELRRRWSQPG